VRLPLPRRRRGIRSISAAFIEQPQVEFEVLVVVDRSAK
jgi:hypothetical protein